MDSPTAIVAVLLVSIFLVGGGAVAQLVYEDTGDHTTVDESVDTGSIGTLVTLNDSNLEGVFYDETVNVTNGSDVQMVPGDDYQWFEQNGTLEVLSQSLANETGATVQYDYRRPTQTQTAFADRFATLIDTGIWIPMVLVLGLLFAALGVFGGLS